MQELSHPSAALVAGLSTESTKQFRDGGRRSVAPEQTLSRLMPLLSKVGVTRIANIAGLDRIGVPVVAICRPNSRSLAVYQGKGATLAAAKASGLMESFERYHAEYARPPEVFASYGEMRNLATTVSMEMLPKRNEAVFQAELKRGWIQGVNLLSQKPIWVPHEIVHYSTAGEFCSDHYFSTASTGLAAGNTYSEAILHGICEVIERDCSTLWRLRVPAIQNFSRIDLTTINDPLCVELIRQIVAAGLTLAAWETTSEIGISSFLCRIADPQGADPMPYELLDAAGCHPVREVALARAILEAVQGRATMISGARDDLFYNYYEANDAQIAAKMREDVQRGWSPRSFQDVPTFDGPTIESDIAYVLAKFGAAGIQHVIAVCLTRHDLKIPVVRVIIPELEDGELSDDYSPRERAIRAFRGRS